MHFYNILVIFTDKDFDLQVSVEFNKLYLEKQFDKEVLGYLIEMTSDHMSDFDEIRRKLMEEYHFLKGYFADKFHDFKNQRLKDKYMHNEEERIKIRMEIEEAKSAKQKSNNNNEIDDQTTETDNDDYGTI